MNYLIHTHKTRKAMVLPLAILMITIIALVGLALLRLGLDSRVFAARTTSGLTARGAADAGIIKALVEMQNNLVEAKAGGPTVRKDEIELAAEVDIPLPSSGAKYSYSVGPYVSGQGFTITSTGYYAGQTKTVKARIGFRSLLFGIGVKNTVDVKLGTTFTNTPPEAEMTVHTNSTESNQILLKMGVVIPGDVAIGLGGDLDEVIFTKKDTVIMGDTYQSEPIDFPLPEPPVGLSAGIVEFVEPDPITEPDVDPYFLINSSGVFTSLTIDIGDTLYISSFDPENYPLVEVYIEGDTRLHNNASLIVAAGTIAHIYLGGNLISDNGSDIYNENLSAATLTLYGLEGCTVIDLKAKSDFYGYIYAPNAEIILFNSGDFYGAITGDSFAMKNSGVFNYVAEIADSVFIDKNFDFKIVSWWEE